MCRWSEGASAILHLALAGACTAEVTASRCDSALREEVQGVTAALARSRDCPGIAGVINSGGVLSDAVLAAQTAGEPVHQWHV